jgi:hypothetical protein
MFTLDGKGAPSVKGSLIARNLSYVIAASDFTNDGYCAHSKAERDQTMIKLTY